MCVAYVADFAGGKLLELASGVWFRVSGFVSYVAILHGLLEVITGVAEALGVGGAVREVSSHTCFRFPESEANKRSECASHTVPLFREPE